MRLGIAQAGRSGATGAVRFYSLWAALYQLGGIGFVTPALWLPAYHAAAQAAAATEQPRTVSLARVRVTGASQLLRQCAVVMCV